MDRTNTPRQSLIIGLAARAHKATLREIAADVQSGATEGSFSAMYAQAADGRNRRHVEEILSEKTEGEWGVSLTCRLVTEAATMADRMAYDRIRDLELRQLRG